MNIDTNKRKISPKPQCKFGAQCYRTNPKHKEEYSHPSDNKLKLSEEPVKKKQKIKDYFTSTSTEQSKPSSSDEGLNPSTLSPEKESETSLDNKTENADIGNESGNNSLGNTSGYRRRETISDEETADSSEEFDNVDEENVEDSPVDIKENMKQKFLVEMPNCFYDFWEFAKSLDATRPECCLKKALGFTLCGPYDILAGRLKKTNKDGKKICYLTHCRYYYDPPEFLTIVRGNPSSQFHLGYFRDDPLEMPCFVASSEPNVNCLLKPRGDNIFGAINWYIDDKIKRCGKTMELSGLQKSLKDWAKKGDYCLDAASKSMKERNKKVLTKTFHSAGMVVPVDENEVGYRELPETDEDLKKILKKIVNSKSEEEKLKNFEPLVEIITLVQFANDECDYGEGLELAIDLFCNGNKVFHKTILNLMPLAYQLLGRPQFKKIVEAHLKNRRDNLDEDK